MSVAHLHLSKGPWGHLSKSVHAQAGKFVCKPEITSPGPAEGQESGTPAAAMATSSAAAEQAGAEGSTPAPAVLGMQTIKQFMSAASLLQSMQQRMLRADFTPASIAHDASVSKVGCGLQLTLMP